MSNNAPDYEDNHVFPPQDDQIVGEPEGKLKGKVTPLSEQEFNEIKAKTAQVISGCVLAATYELKDQIQIKDMRISKLKQKLSAANITNDNIKQLLKASFPYVALHNTLEAEALQNKIREALND